MFQAEGRSSEAGMFQKQEAGAAGAGGVGVRGRSQGRGHDWQVSVRVWVLFQWYRRNGCRGLKPCWLWNPENQLEGGEGGVTSLRGDGACTSRARGGWVWCAFGGGGRDAEVVSSWAEMREGLGFIPPCG